VVIDKITLKAKSIKAFKSLPITAQVALLHGEIMEARKFRIPLSAICAALNEAGSTVTVRYFREVLFVLRKSGQNTISSSGVVLPDVNDVRGNTVNAYETKERNDHNLSPSERRQQKADFYTKLTNPLLHQLKKGKE